MRRYSRRTRTNNRKRSSGRRYGRGMRRTYKARKPAMRLLPKARVETKRAIHGATITPYPVGHINFITQIIPITPYDAYLTINRGTNRSERVGNMISVKKLMFRFVFTMNERDVTSNDATDVQRPYYVRLWLWKLKPRLPQNVNEAATVAQNTFFQWGTAADQGLLGNVNDLIQPINEEHVELLTTKTYKLARASYANQGLAGAAQTEANLNMHWVNNDFQLSARGAMDVTKYVPKNIKFDDGSSSTSINRPLWVMCTLHCADGTAHNTTNFTGDPQPVAWFYRTDLDYIDP